MNETSSHEEAKAFTTDVVMTAYRETEPSQYPDTTFYTIVADELKKLAEETPSELRGNKAVDLIEAVLAVIQAANYVQENKELNLKPEDFDKAYEIVADFADQKMTLAKEVQVSSGGNSITDKAQSIVQDWRNLDETLGYLHQVT